MSNSLCEAMNRVLLVDDSITQQVVIKRALVKDDQFTVVGEAEDGRKAVELVRKTDPDVVLMDIHMPDMDGIEATRAIMSEHSVPIVIASSTLKERDVDHGMKAFDTGAVSVIAKPEGRDVLHRQ